jgi:kynurenine formamidase
MLYDLSHAITTEESCSFSTIDRRPKIFYEEGESQGLRFISSVCDNLHSNTGTHVVAPGYVPGYRKKYSPSIGSYPIDRFIGSVLVVDCSRKLSAIDKFFDESGKIVIKPTDGKLFIDFLCSISHMEITASEIEEVAECCNCNLNSITGILFYSGLSSFWKYRKFESWEYLYFFSPYLSLEASELIIKHNFSFVGIDALQLENPISNFCGDELPLVLNDECRNYVHDKLQDFKIANNHTILLGNDILIYENLNIPLELINRIVNFSGVPLNFQIEGLNDNSLVRPYAFFNS